MVEGALKDEGLRVNFQTQKDWKSCFMVPNPTPGFFPYQPSFFKELQGWA